MVTSFLHIKFAGVKWDFSDMLPDSHISFMDNSFLVCLLCGGHCLQPGLHWEHSRYLQEVGQHQKGLPRWWQCWYWFVQTFQEWLSSWKWRRWAEPVTMDNTGLSGHHSGEIDQGGSPGGPSCRCSECERLKCVEDKWICRMGSFYGDSGLNTRDEVKSRSRVNFVGQ